MVPTLGAIAPRAPALVPVPGAEVLAVEGGLVRYQSTGSGSEAVLFLHGFNSQLSIWSDVWPHVTACGRSVRIDIPGYGGSTWPAASYALPDQAARVMTFIDALGLTRVTLVGVSMGGSLAAWLAAHYPTRIKGLVLVAPSGYPGSLQYKGPFGHLLGNGLVSRAATWVADTSAYRWLYPDSRALHALTVTASYGDAWARALASIRVHTWLVWSRGDATVPFANAEAVARAIPVHTLIPLAAHVGHDLPAKRVALIGELACRVHRGESPEVIQRALDASLQHNGDR
ncbi:MAG: alpha/beta fold hydrolase [Kofleriaceae bacterium]|nr:alpha/beta fold hydrolase [Kofleriaceae bacterium]